MRNLYLYPGADLRPLESVEGYKDYLLSDLLRYNEFKMDYGEMRYASEPLGFVNGFPRAVSYCLAVVFLERTSDGVVRYLVFAPVDYHRNDNELAVNPESYVRDKDDISPARFFSDLRVRFYLFPGGVRRPVWVSMFSGDNEYHESFSNCPYCTELISGPVLRVARSYAELGIVSEFLSVIE